MMVGSFNFNNIESSYYSLVCKSVKRPLLPAVKLRRLELPSLSGIFDFGDGEDNEYEMRTITMKIQYIGTSYEELRTRARDIATWLSIPTFAKLILNDEPDKYYNAKITSETDLETLWESGSADITFDCQPFAYAVTPEEILEEDASGNIYFTNPGTRTITYKSPPGSQFDIICTGMWDALSITLNGKTLTCPGILPVPDPPEYTTDKFVRSGRWYTYEDITNTYYKTVTADSTGKVIFSEGTVETVTQAFNNDDIYHERLTEYTTSYVSSNEWDISEDPQTYIYYKDVYVDSEGVIRGAGFDMMTAADAYADGRIYRLVDGSTTLCCKITGVDLVNEIVSFDYREIESIPYADNLFYQITGDGTLEGALVDDYGAYYIEYDVMETDLVIVPPPTPQPGILTIDNINMEATWDESHTPEVNRNVFDLLGGDIDTFLKIIGGDNTITIDGTNVSIDLEINYIPLWL